jgi:penicillin amidase
VATALRAWDGTMGADRTEPVIFYTWYRALQRLTFEDELAGTYAPGGVLQAAMRASASPWFDDVRTPAREGMEEMSVRAMREALPVAGTQRWGDVHRSVSRHTLGGARPLDLALRLNLGPDPRAGSLYTVNVGDFGSFTPPFTNTHAASFRQVVDMASPNDGAFIITSGQAGNPLSRHYRDQKHAWYAGLLARVPIDGPFGTSVLRLAP